LNFSRSAPTEELATSKDAARHRAPGLNGLRRTLARLPLPLGWSYAAWVLLIPGARHPAPV